MYYQKKLLSIANNRVETYYVGLRYQGLNAYKTARQDIEKTESGWYKVQRQTVRGEYYSVNTIIGVCTCTRGRDGSPCVHQAAVVIKCGEYSLNFTSSASSAARLLLAEVALGEGAIEHPGFYSCLHQQSLEESSTCKNKHACTTDFNGSQWNLIHAGSESLPQHQEPDNHEQLPDVEETCALIENIAQDLKRRLRQTPIDKQLHLGSHKFAQRYKAHESNALLESALHRFGWVFAGSIKSKRLGNIRHGKRI